MKLNWMDKALAGVAPGLALKRVSARSKLDFIAGAGGGYGNHGASRTANWVKGWMDRGGSAEEDILPHLDTLRKRSRDLDAGGGVVRAALRTVRTNVVGGGLTLRPRVDAELLGMSGQEAEAWQRQALREFELWAEDVHCDADKVMNFYGLQQLLQLSWMMSGDAFVLLQSRQEPGRVYDLRLKALEADRVCTPDGGDEAALAGNRILDGVEVDPFGAVVAYHIVGRDAQGQRVWSRVPAFGEASGRHNVLHLLETERPEQYRGVPLVAPVIEQLKQLERYTSAELMNAVISGMFTVFIESERSGMLDDMFQEEEGGASRGPGYQLGNGSILELYPGEKVHFANPTRPNSAFDVFVRNLCTQIGAALEIPRDVLLKEFGQSYSASRGALLEFWKMNRMRREWLTWDFCQPVYEEWLTEAVAKGRLSAPGFFADPLIRRAYSGAEWHGPTPGQLDPKKEVEAAIMRVQLGVSTIEREAAEINGSDWAANAMQRRREEELFGPGLQGLAIQATGDEDED